MTMATTSNSLVERMMRAAKLDQSLYEEVERDESATTQALTIVVLVSLASGISSAIAGANEGGLVGGLIGGIISSLIGWAIWSFVNYFVGTRLFGGTATWGELMRTLGFAYTPGILGILGFIPVLGVLIGLAVGIWTLVASFVGIRAALDIDTGKTIATMIISAVVVFVVVFVLGLLLAAIGLGGLALLGGV